MDQHTDKETDRCRRKYHPSSERQQYFFKNIIANMFNMVLRLFETGTGDNTKVAPKHAIVMASRWWAMHIH